MSRAQFNDGMEMVFEDWNRLQSLAEQELYDRVVYELVQRAQNAFFGDGFIVSLATATSITVNSGLGFQTDATVAASEPQKRLLYLGSNQTLNITAPDSVNDRIDIVVVKHNRAVTDTDTRKFKDASTSVISNESLDVENDWSPDVELVDGTPAGSPSAPATPAGYIKIAEVLVEAVSGITGSGNITDTRTLMPLGASATINSLAFGRLTQSAALTLQQAFEEVDDLLENGELTTNIFADSVSDPAAPAAGSVKIYNKGGLMFARDGGGLITPLGGGGGGGGAGAQWLGDALEELEYGQDIKKFPQGDSNKETLYVKVPTSYIAGRQVLAKLGAYSPSASNEWNLQIVTTLIRKGQDAITSTANQVTNDSGDITNDQADEFREVSIDLSSATGQINGFSISPGDLLKLELTRNAPGGTEDTADLRFVPSATEIIFG